jgi:hypothetical protein
MKRYQQFSSLRGVIFVYLRDNAHSIGVAL